MSDKASLEVPEEFRRGHYKANESTHVDSGQAMIELMCRKIGIPDLGSANVLDMGCGNKFTQAILNNNLPLKRYVGIDIHPGLIEHLKANVSDGRFSFHVSTHHNEMYNPEGEPLTENSQLPLEENSFDLICLFSVFTHLAPHDYVNMLKLLRRYIKPEGKLFFTLFVNERTEGGHGLIDQFAEGISAQLSEEDIKKGMKGPPDFTDWYPERPLWRALYSRSHATELVEGTGWEIESLHDPEKDIQHHMICTPV